MRSELGQWDGPTALVFPGQGAHGPEMLEPFREAPSFSGRYAQVCGLLGGDPLRMAAEDPPVLQRNAVSSLLTVLASVCALELFRAEHPALPVAYAGYSVGQWTALHAAGRISADDLFAVVAERARLMDACLSAEAPSGMLAVIGVREQDLETVCDRIRLVGAPLVVANYNAPGQFTVSGTEPALRAAEEQLAPLQPKRVVRLAVAGAWHSPEMRPAVAGLASLLREVRLQPARAPVVDNVSGEWLPDEPDACRAALARQVAEPVRWMQGVRAMAARGVTHVIEVGYGDVLTKFGFFVDRSLTHRAMAPSSPSRSR